jgi:hypothetical protein
MRRRPRNEIQQHQTFDAQAISQELSAYDFEELTAGR